MAEITNSNPDRPFTVPNYTWILLALLALAAYFAGLNLPLVGPDEPRYAQVAREMFDRGDWITPTLGGHPWFEKPALLYWFEIAAYNLFGVTEFAARIGAALSGIGTVSSLWILGRSTDHGSPNFANWLALVAASTLGIFVFAHGASFDILITFTLTASLVSFFIFDQTGRRAPLAAFYVFVGLSLLAKGLIGLVFPAGIIFLYFLLSRKLPSRAFVLSLLWGTVLTVALASIWYVPVYVRNGWPFVEEFIIQHHFQRFMSNKYQHPQPFYFFLWVLPLMTLPWLPFFVAGLWKFARKVMKDRPTSEFALLVFAMCWIVVPLVFFSLSGSKLPGYILPAVPGTIIITALYLTRLARSKAWALTAIAIAAVIFVGSIAAVKTILPRFAEHESVKGLFAAASNAGFDSEPVYSLHTIVHGTEFYAPARLLRDPDAKQKKLYGPSEVVSEMQRVGAARALVIVPLEYQHQLDENKQLHVEFLKDNGEVAIYAVTLN